MKSVVDVVAVLWVFSTAVPYWNQEVTWVCCVLWRTLLYIGVYILID